MILFVILLAVIAFFSGCKDYLSAFLHVFILFLSVNLFDMVVLDWGIFCHSKKLRIPGTEDMDSDYRNYSFHFKGFIKGTLLGLIASALSGLLVLLIENVICA